MTQLFVKHVNIEIFIVSVYFIFGLNKISHYVKSVQKQSFSGPYSVQIQENTDQKNSVLGQFWRSEFL